MLNLHILYIYKYIYQVIFIIIVCIYNLTMETELTWYAMPVQKI